MASRRPPRPPRPTDSRPPDDGGWTDDVRWEPPSRNRPAWQTARLAGLLGIVLVVLLGVAFVLPGLRLPGPSAGPVGTLPPGSAVAGSPSAVPSQTFVRPTPTPQPTFTAYTVRTGDSLTSIARQFGTTARSIAFWNRAAYPSLDPLSEGYDPNRIDIGWKLQLIPGVTYDELATPSPDPGSATPTPAAPTPPPGVPSATPPPTSGGPATVIDHGPRGTNKIALTFDMGGRLDPAEAMMQFLLDNRVHATIFPTGKQATEQPQGRAAMDVVRAHPELFELANHSWDHPSFTDLTPEQMRDQLLRSEEALVASLGRTTRPYFRPPFGSWNRSVRETVGGQGWSYVVMWDIDTIDWRPTSDGGPTAGDIEAKVLANAQGGSIVLMHLGGWHTLEALPDILAGLRAKGLEPVTLTELLR